MKILFHKMCNCTPEKYMDATPMTMWTGKDEFVEYLTDAVSEIHPVLEFCTPVCPDCGEAWEMEFV